MLLFTRLATHIFEIFSMTTQSNIQLWYYWKQHSTVKESIKNKPYWLIKASPAHFIGQELFPKHQFLISWIFDQLTSFWFRNNLDKKFITKIWILQHNFSPKYCKLYKEELVLKCQNHILILVISKCPILQLNFRKILEWSWAPVESGGWLYLQFLKSFEQKQTKIEKNFNLN